MPDEEPRPLWSKTPPTLFLDRTWTLADVRVYGLLDFRAGRRGWWRTTQQVIATDLHIGHRTVKRAVAHLRRGGLITTERHGAIDGEITYRIVARQPREVAVPLAAEGPPVALPIRSVGPPASTGGAIAGPSVARARDPISRTGPQTTTTDPEESPRSRRNRERREQQATQRAAYERIVRRA